MNTFRTKRYFAAWALSFAVLTFSCKGKRARSYGEQGDVGSGGVQVPNSSDSTKNHDSSNTRKLIDTGVPPKR